MTVPAGGQHPEGPHHHDEDLAEYGTEPGQLDVEPWKHQAPCNVCGEQHAGYELAHFTESEAGQFLVESR